MIQKKNKFWRLIFSLLPGAGEMYMGFMKMGVSLMGIFFTILTVSSVLRFDVLIFMAIVVWCYSFFHVHNLADMPDEEFYAVEDVYLISVDKIFFHEKKMQEFPKRVVGILLIITGMYMAMRELLNACMWFLPEMLGNMLYDIVYRIPQIFTGIGIVVLGVYMIRGKKQEMDSREEKQQKKNRQLETDAEEM